MNFVRQRVAGVLLVVGLVLAWICLTGVVVRQTLLLSARAPSYALAALKSPVIRSTVSELIINSVQNEFPIVGQIPAAELRPAIEEALTQPAVANEFANAALQVQQHFIGLNDQPIVLGGPQLSAAVAQIIAPNNLSAQQVIKNIAFSYTIASDSIPSIGRYYSKIGTLITTSLIGGLALLISSVLVSAKKSRTIRKIGMGFVAMSIFEVAIFWLLPRYVLPNLQSGPWVIFSAIMTASASTIEPLYLGVFGAGVALIVVSILF
ncbi:MAG: hypothetical protein M0Z39_03650 [Actinomycetota bacterium]|nr:hypothetical protein [Actinomycetota bacterium]